MRARVRCRRCAAARRSSSARMHNEPREKVLREVILPETITIQELAQRMSERAVDVVKYFMKQGQIMKPGDVIDADTAELVASEFGHTVKPRRRVRHRGRPVQHRRPRRGSGLAAAGRHHHGPRRPRQDLAARRHPQRQRRVRRGRRHHPAHRRLPGREERPEDHLHRHARPRRLHGDARPRRAGDRHRHPGGGGRRQRDAADDRVDQPRQGGRRADHRGDQQDRQAEADPQKVRTELLRHEVFVESMGGEVLDVEVSATKGTNLDKLLEAILLQAELLDLKANPTAPRKAWSSRPSSTRAAARSPPCWCRPAR